MDVKERKEAKEREMRDAEEGVGYVGEERRAEENEDNVNERRDEDCEQEGEEAGLDERLVFIQIGRMGRKDGARTTTGLGPILSAFFFSPGRSLRGGRAVGDPATGRHNIAYVSWIAATAGREVCIVATGSSMSALNRSRNMLACNRMWTWV